MTKPTAEVRRRWRKKAIHRMVIELPNALFDTISDGMKEMKMSRREFLVWAYGEAVKQGLISIGGIEDDKKDN